MLSDINYIREPDDLQCGQAVLAMVTGIPVREVARELGNFRETTFKEMKAFLTSHGFSVSGERRAADSKADLPKISLLSLETPRCWHWSLYFCGTFYDPEHGVMSDFPECARKYYWEIKEIPEKER